MVRRPARAVVGALLIAAAVALAGGCADFEDPSIVIDLRVLGVVAEPAEIVLPFDPGDPGAGAGVSVSDLGPVEVCALVADPGAERRLRYDFQLCPPESDGRCDGHGATVVELGGGEVGDPESSERPVSICTTIQGSADVLQVIRESVEASDLAGFGGISVEVGLEVVPVGASDDEAVWARKKVRYSPELPAGRVANQNPWIDGMTAAREPTGERGLDFEAPRGRCGDVVPFAVAPGEKITLLPREPAGVREDYEVPTFDGGAQAFTENLSYQWLATAGKWSRGSSGGKRDLAGNQPPLDSRWTAPDDPDVVGEGLDVQLWSVQRDERGGQSWFETCARVVP